MTDDDTGNANSGQFGSRVLKRTPLTLAIPVAVHKFLVDAARRRKMKPEDLRLSGKQVTMALPRAQITDAYLDERETKIIEHNTSFLRDFNKDLEQTARLNAVEDIRRAARTSGILKDADDRARAQLKYFFSQLGFEVEFK